MKGSDISVGKDSKFSWYQQIIRWNLEEKVIPFLSYAFNNQKFWKITLLIFAFSILIAIFAE